MNNIVVLTRNTTAADSILWDALIDWLDDMGYGTDYQGTYKDVGTVLDTHLNIGTHNLIMAVTYLGERHKVTRVKYYADNDHTTDTLRSVMVVDIDDVNTALQIKLKFA
jgi:hypothetical protein